MPRLFSSYTYGSTAGLALLFACSLPLPAETEIGFAEMFVPAEERRELVQAINEHFRQLRENGYPVNLDELNVYYTYPKDGDVNAAEIYGRAFGMIPRGRAGPLVPFEGEADVPEPGDRYTPEQRSAIEDFLEERADALRLIEEAARQPLTRFDVDFRDGYEVLSPQVGRMRQAARILSLRIHLSAEEGDTEAIVKDLETMAALSAAVSKEPLLISYLTGTAISNMTLNALVWSLSHVEFSAKQLQQLDEIVSQFASSPDLVRAFSGERALAINAFRTVGFAAEDAMPWFEFSNKLSDRLTSILLFAHLQVSGYWLKDFIFYLEVMDHAVALANLAPELRRHAPEWEEIDRLNNLAWPKRYILSSIIASSERNMLEMDSRHRDRVNACRLALRLEGTRMRTGSYPESLEEIALDGERDITKSLVTGEPFLYSYHNYGFTIDPQSERAGPFVVDRSRLRSNKQP